MRFLFVDCIEQFESDKRLVSRTAFPRSLAYTPGRPDGPGPSSTILLESIAQSGGWLLNASVDFRSFAMLSLARGFRVTTASPTSQVLRCEVSLRRRSESFATVEGVLRTTTDEEVASVVSLTYVFAPSSPGDQQWMRDYYAGLRADQRARPSGGRHGR